MQQIDIHLIQAGGTCDKGYPPNPTNHGYNFEIGEPASTSIVHRHIERYCDNSNCRRHRFHFSTACRLDSLDMQDENRQAVQDAMDESFVIPTIVTHGTDTIIQTAEFIAPFVKSRKKKVIITGSLEPSVFKGSDFEFNLGVSIGGILFIPEGEVYIALNSTPIPWKEYVPA